MEDTRHPALQILTDGLDDDIVDAQRALAQADTEEERQRLLHRLSTLLRRAGRDEEADTLFSGLRDQFARAVIEILAEIDPDDDIETSPSREYLEPPEPPKPGEPEEWIRTPSGLQPVRQPAPPEPPENPDVVTLWSFYVSDQDFYVKPNGMIDTPFGDRVDFSAALKAARQVIVCINVGGYLTDANNAGDIDGARIWDAGVAKLKQAGVTPEQYDMMVGQDTGEVLDVAMDVTPYDVEDVRKRIARRDRTGHFEVTSDIVEVPEGQGAALKVTTEHESYNGEIIFGGEALVRFAEDYSVTVSHWGKEPETPAGLEQACEEIAATWHGELERAYEQSGEEEYLQGFLDTLMSEVERELADEYDIDVLVNTDYDEYDAEGKRIPAFSVDGDITVRVDNIWDEPSFDLVYPDMRELPNLGRDEMLTAIAGFTQGAVV